jgi:hypothetical protein
MFRRFLNYADKVFGLSEALSQITDTRSASRIPTPSVLWSSFMMQVTRLGSLNALEVELRWPKRLDALIGPTKPSAETIGRVFAKICPADLRRLHGSLCYRLKRNKVLQTDWPLQAIGLDGHEFFSHCQASMAGVLRTNAYHQERRNTRILLPHGGR